MKLPAFNPSEPEVITDDNQAQEIMLYLGAWDALARMPQHQDTGVVLVQDHPTHWFTCIRIRNNPDPAENGFMIWVSPKAVVPFWAVMDHVYRMLSGSSQVDAGIAEGVPWE